jgi:hypothetical protein
MTDYALGHAGTETTFNNSINSFGVSVSVTIAHDGVVNAFSAYSAYIGGAGSVAWTWDGVDVATFSYGGSYGPATISGTPTPIAVHAGETHSIGFRVSSGGSGVALYGPSSGVYDLWANDASTVPGTPAAPTLVVNSPSSVTVNWTSPGGVIASWNVEHSLNGTTGWSAVATGLAGTSTTYTNTTAPTKGFYRVVAVNSEGSATSAAAGPADLTSAPTLTAHAPFPANSAATFFWTFSDPDAGDTQSAYQIEVFQTVGGVLVYDSGQVISAAGSHVLPANILTNLNLYHFVVRTWDSYGVVGPFSAASFFYADSAPNAPALAPRSPFDATASTAFTWTFSDPDAGDSQSAYELLIQRQSDGVTIYDTGKVISAAGSHTLPGGTLSNNFAYRFLVRTWDTIDVVGPYSAASNFNTDTPPNAPVLTPKDSFDATGATTFAWTFSDPDLGQTQGAFQLIIQRTSDSAVVYDSAEVISSSQSFNLPANSIANSASYFYSLRTWDNFGLVGPFAVGGFNCSTPPNAPVPTVRTIFDANGSAVFAWTFSDPNVGDTQGSSQIQIRRQSDGALVYDSGLVTNSSPSFTLPGGTIPNNAAYTWTVRTGDNWGVVGPYSVSSSFSTNTPPSAPSLDVRANFDALSGAVFTWTFNDPDTGDSQSAFELQITRVSDSAIVFDTAKIGGAAGSYTLPGGSIPNGDSYTFRVRTWDSHDFAGSYSAQSAAFLTTATPSAPVLRTRTPFNAAASAEFSWDVAEPGRGQTKYELLITRQSDGGVAYDSGQITSGSNTHTLTGGTLVNGVAYLFTVRIQDLAGAQSPYATAAAFVTSAPPVVTITTPAADGALIGDTSITTTWTLSDPEGKGQSHFVVRLTTSADVELYSSGKTYGKGNYGAGPYPPALNTSARSFAIPYTLSDLTAYKIKITVWDTDGIPSAETVRSFSTNFARPLAPTFVIDTPSAGAIRLTVTNPVGGAAVVTNDIYRKLDTESAFMRIATGLAPNPVFVDYNVPIGVVATYYVVGISAALTTATSATAFSRIGAASGLLLHAISSPASSMTNLLWDEARTEELTQTVALLQYVGRRRPVAEFDGTGGHTVRAGVTLPGSGSGRAQLIALLAAQDVICYRDQRSRRVFGVLKALPFTDDVTALGTDALGTYATTIEITEVDYTEAV